MNGPTRTNGRAEPGVGWATGGGGYRLGKQGLNSTLREESKEGQEMKDSVIRLFFLWEKQNVATDGHE